MGPNSRGGGGNLVGTYRAFATGRRVNAAMGALTVPVNPDDLLRLTAPETGSAVLHLTHC